MNGQNYQVATEANRKLSQIEQDLDEQENLIESCKQELVALENKLAPVSVTLPMEADSDKVGSPEPTRSLLADRVHGNNKQLRLMLSVINSLRAAVDL